MSRKIYYWKLRDAELQLGERTLIMGVLNVTPDSFSDGGRFNDPDRALARALELEEQGADIIDIGAESTRPGSARITADEEWQRLVPVLKALRDKLRVPLSLDTYKSEIAERALQYGIQIFNDPSGLTYDPGLAKVAANANAGLILNHMRGTPETWAKMPPIADPMNTIGLELGATISRARLAGVDRTRIVVDPGIGFGKRKEQNSEILGKLAALADLEYPILIGASRKSFLPQQSEADTLFATAAAVAIAAFNGAHIVRVHDVKQMQSVLLVADEIARMAAYTNPALEKDAATAARPPKPRPQVRQEEERVRPMRPPLAKPVAVEPPPAPPEAVAAPEPAAEVKAEEKPEVRPEPRPFVKRDTPQRRTPGKFEDRNRGKQERGGWAPPPRRESPRDSRPSRESRPPKPGDRFGAPKSDRPRWAPKSDRPGSDRPRSDRPRSGPPRSDRPRSGPPRSDRPRSGPPRSDRPASDRPRSGPPRSGPPRSDRPRSGPPRSDRPASDRPGSGPPRSDRSDSRPPRDGRPPRRPFRKRP